MKLRTTSLAAAALVLAAACAPAPPPSDTPLATRGQPCNNECRVLVSNPGAQEIEVYYNALREPPQLLGTVNPNGTARFVVPMETAEWVFVSVRTAANGRTIDARRLMLSPARMAEFRVNLDRMH
ncbi:MAG TPA: hypothetical protein VF092_22740 [Longimicrobium sp.]